MRRILVVACLLALGGCSAVSDLLSFDKTSDDQPVAVQSEAPAPVAAAPDDSFCQNVALQDATRGAFDPETQKRMAAQSYSQCRAIYGGGAIAR